MAEENKMDAEAARHLLNSLRWTADMDIVDEYGEHSWLGPCFDESGKRIGLTVCCPVDAPCPHHAPMKPRRAN